MLTVFGWFVVISLGAPLIGILLALVAVAWMQIFQLAAFLFYRRRRTYICFE